MTDRIERAAHDDQDPIEALKRALIDGVFTATCSVCGSRDEYSRPDPPEHTCGHFASPVLVSVPGLAALLEAHTPDRVALIVAELPLPFRQAIREAIDAEEMSATQAPPQQAEAGVLSRLIRALAAGTPARQPQNRDNGQLSPKIRTPPGDSS